MNRNRLKGTQGDQLNAVLSAAGMNFRKLLRRSQGKRCNQAAEPPALFGGLRYHHNYRRAEKEFDEVLTHNPV